MLPVTARLFRAAKHKWEIFRAHALEPVTGIGPAFPAWKAGVLPLNHTGVLPSVRDVMRSCLPHCHRIHPGGGADARHEAATFGAQLPPLYFTI